VSNAKGVKRQREKARQEKQATKRERRQGRLAADGTPEDGDGEPIVTYSQDQVLAELAELHRRYGDGGLSLEDFEEARDELVQRLRVD
jgi:hypothetical protein